MGQESAQQAFAAPPDMLPDALSVKHLVSSIIQSSREFQRVFILGLYNLPHFSAADISQQMELITLVLETWSNDFYDVLDNVCIGAILYQRIIDLRGSDPADLRSYLNVCLSKTKAQRELCYKVQHYLSLTSMAGELELIVKQLRCWADEIKSDGISSSERVCVTAFTIGFLENIKSLLGTMDSLQKLVQRFSERNALLETHLQTMLDGGSTSKFSDDEAEILKQKWSWHVQELIWLQAGLRHGRSTARKNLDDFMTRANNVEPMNAHAKSFKGPSDTSSVHDSNKYKRASLSSRTLYAFKSRFRRHFSGRRWHWKVGSDNTV